MVFRSQIIRIAPSDFFMAACGENC